MRVRQSVLFVFGFFLLSCWLVCSGSVRLRAAGGVQDGMRGDDPDFPTKVLCCYRDGQKIYGEIYMPEGDGPFPLAIVGHGLGGSHRDVARYARDLHQLGIAVYVFDFCGGGKHVKSDGNTRDMSLFTELEDMEAVLDQASSWPFVDREQIILAGGSQGGEVAAIAAARHADRIAGVAMLFPAFVVRDYVHLIFDSPDQVPEEFNLMGWITIGKKYVEDIWDYDPFEEIGGYKGPVLLLQGDSDIMVPVSSSDKAARCYGSIEYHVIAGGGHGFLGDSYKTALWYLRRFFKKNIMGFKASPCPMIFSLL